LVAEAKSEVPDERLRPDPACLSPLLHYILYQKWIYLSNTVDNYFKTASKLGLKLAEKDTKLQLHVTLTLSSPNSKMSFGTSFTFSIILGLRKQIIKVITNYHYLYTYKADSICTYWEW